MSPVDWLSSTNEAGSIPQSGLVVSVIMPALDAAATLTTALNSFSQQSTCCEAILVDGGSSDDTVAIASAVPGVRVVSAPGTSIYQAINRGIEEARAPTICLLNADDVLLPDALATLTDALARNPEAGIARGRPRFTEMDAAGMHAARPEADRHANQPLTLELLLRGPCAINSLCIRSEVFARIGLFDPAYRLAADRDWMLRAYRAGVEIAEVDAPVYRYLIHPGSSTLDCDRRNFGLIRQEHLAIVARVLTQAIGGPIHPQTRKLLRRWHAAEAAMLCQHLLSRREWREVRAVIHRAFRTDPNWLSALASDTIVRTLWRHS